jgi:hypothetical protein
VKPSGKIVILRCRMGMTILKASFTGALPDGLKKSRPQTRFGASCSVQANFTMFRKIGLLCVLQGFYCGPVVDRS